MFQRLSARKPVLSVNEVAETISNKFFKEEIDRTFFRMKVRLADTNQIIAKPKFNLVITSLFMFVVECSTVAVFGDSSTKNKILKAFYLRIKDQFNEHYDFIAELSRKFHSAYNENPDEPVLSLGISFAGCINKKNKLDFLSAVTGITETTKKYKMITNYFKLIKEEFKIC